MAYNFGTKAYKSYDVHIILGYIFIRLAAIKLSVERRITYFNYYALEHIKTLCSRDYKIIGN